MPDSLTKSLLPGGRPSAADACLEKEMVIAGFTGGEPERLLKECFFDPFSEMTGVRVHAVAANDSEQWAKVKAMVDAGDVQWDIVTAGPNNLLSFPELLVRLECGMIPNLAAQGVPGACNEHGVLRYVGATVLAYNTTAFGAGQGPRSWSDFWDVKRFPGPRALRNASAPWYVLAAALLADGVTPGGLFPMDLDRAFRKLDEIRPHVSVWWKTGEQSQQAMRDGGAVMALMWSSPALALKAAGAPVEIQWNQAIKAVGYWSVLKGAPHPRSALAFLNFFVDRPEAHLEYMRKWFCGTANRVARDLLSPAERSSYPWFPANWDQTIAVLENPWVGRNRDLMLERWDAWLTT